MNRYNVLSARRSGPGFVTRSFNRYLTQISIGIAGLGIMMVVLGPVREAIRPLPPSAAESAATVLQDKTQNNNRDNGGGDSAVRIDRRLVPFTIIPNRPRDTVTGYLVKAGDTIFGIAGKYGLKPETLLWSNQDILQDNVDLLVPGVNLAILPMDGVYTTADGTRSLQNIVEDNGGTVDSVINSRYNQLAGYKPTDIPPWGMRIVVPGGERAIVSWAPPVTTVTVKGTNGKSRVVTGFMQGMPGSCSLGIAGGGGSGLWLNPIPSGSYTITQPYASWHSGIDMAAVTGETVVASDTGVVVFAGWNNFGYGDLVVLDHGNGWTTYYAHLNSHTVGCGATVQRGQAIGGVGATGNATGPHLHFEMRWLHAPDNPASYIGF